MKQFIIGLIVLTQSFVAFAHNPLSARYHLEIDANASLLVINLSQDGVNQVLIKTYGKDYLEGLDEKTFKELIVSYIKESFSVDIDNAKIELSDGGIRLGSHQTDLKFVLQPISREVSTITIAIPAFEENDEHQSIFSYSIYGKSDKVILSKRNDYQAKVHLNIQQAESSWVFGIGVLIIGGTMLLFLRRKTLANKV